MGFPSRNHTGWRYQILFSASGSCSSIVRARRSAISRSVGASASLYFVVSGCKFVPFFIPQPQKESTSSFDIARGIDGPKLLDVGAVSGAAGDRLVLQEGFKSDVVDVALTEASRYAARPRLVVVETRNGR